MFGSLLYAVDFDCTCALYRFALSLSGARRFDILGLGVLAPCLCRATVSARFLHS